jgi:adenine-specific DNA methylase
MPPLLDNIRRAMARPRGGRPTCVVCGRSISPRDERLRLRGGTVVHRSCATYDMRRRRVGAARLG